MIGMTNSSSAVLCGSIQTFISKPLRPAGSPNSKVSFPPVQTWEGKDYVKLGVYAFISPRLVKKNNRIAIFMIKFGGFIIFFASYGNPRKGFSSRILL
jgi:hypothetical protein